MTWPMTNAGWKTYYEWAEKQPEFKPLIRLHEPSPNCPCARCAGMYRNFYELQNTDTLERNAISNMEGTYVKPESELKNQFIVWSPEAYQPPKVIYPTKAAAVKVATAMATKFPGQRFTVAKIAGVAQSVKVQYTSFEKGL